MASLNYPTRITIAGAWIGMLGAVLWPRPIGCLLLVVSLAADVVDGHIARAFDCVTELGAKLDWWTDVTIGNALAIAFMARGRIELAGPSIACLIIAQGMTAWWPSRIRASGRALVTAIAMIGALYG